MTGLLDALAEQGWRPGDGPLDPEVAYLVSAERAVAEDPDGYRAAILHSAEDRRISEVAMLALRQCLKDVAAAELPAYRTAESLQICVRDLDLLDRLESVGLPQDDVSAMREELASAAIELTRRIWGNLVTRLVPARVEAREDLAPVHRLDENVPSRPPVTSMAPDEPILVMLTAGRGTRLRSTIPKGLVPLGGRTLAGHVIGAAAGAGIEQFVFVLKYRAKAHLAHLSATGSCLVFDRADGTGHSAFLALHALRDHRGPVLLCYSDTPFLRPATVENALTTLSTSGAALTVSTFAAAEHAQLGRVQRRPDGTILAITQPRIDARQSHSHDGGLYAMDPTRLRAALGGLLNDNPRREYSFTDVVASLTQAGATVAETPGSFDDFLNINSPSDLSVAELRMAGIAPSAALRDAVARQVGPLLGFTGVAGGGT